MEPHVLANWNPVWIRQQILANASALHPHLTLDVLTTFTSNPHHATNPPPPTDFPGFHTAVLIEKPRTHFPQLKLETESPPPGQMDGRAGAGIAGIGGIGGIKVLIYGQKSQYGETHALLNLLCVTQEILGGVLPGIELRGQGQGQGGNGIVGGHGNANGNGVVLAERVKGGHGV